MKELLIPKKYVNKYNFCAYLCNVLLSIEQYATKKHLASENIEFKSKEDALRFMRNEDENIYTKMISFGYKDNITNIIYRHMFFSLVNDILDFISVSLNSIGMMNTTVAFTLLRKPFKDNLLFLELLYTKGLEFVSEFFEKDIKAFDTSRINAEEKKRLIEGCYPKKLSGFNTDFLYEVRYDRKKPYCLENLWNPALHLITTCPDYRTENGNLNFIFSDKKERLSQLDYYFLIVPFLLYYTVKLSIQIFEKYIQPNEVSEFMNSMICTLKLVETTNSRNKARNIRKIIEVSAFVCPECYKFISLREYSDIGYSLAKSYEFICPFCNKITRLDQYLAYEKVIKKRKTSALI